MTTIIKVGQNKFGEKERNMQKWFPRKTKLETINQQYSTTTNKADLRVCTIKDQINISDKKFKQSFSTVFNSFNSIFDQHLK